MRSTGFPSISIVPPSGCSAPDRRLISVDFPAPFSPSSACTRPGKRAIETSRRTVLPKKDFVTPRAARIGTVGTSWSYCPASSVSNNA